MVKPIKRTVCVSERAFHEIKRLISDNPDKFGSRGAVGVVDDLLFHEFTQSGRGSRPKTK